MGSDRNGTHLRWSVFPFEFSCDALHRFQLSAYSSPPCPHFNSLTWIPENITELQGAKWDKKISGHFVPSVLTQLPHNITTGLCTDDLTLLDKFWCNVFLPACRAFHRNTLFGLWDTPQHVAGIGLKQKLIFAFSASLSWNLMDAHADTHSRTSKEQFNFLLIRKALEESDLKGNYSQTETS